ncbi:MAG: prepilin-type N-terminal cleavage/methylation domain-containing protein [Chthoniobacterales bacterium]|nr:prepilin-type N-terminal cleavage/methylation domain-containing protein [Chthoniobacterales bacterium]
MDKKSGFHGRGALHQSSPMNHRDHCRLLAAESRVPRGPRNAFSLIELLVAAAVMAMLLVLTVQILSSTSSAVRLADRHRDTDNQVRVAMDRLTEDFATAMLTGGASALVRSANEPNSYLRFLCLSRVREGSSTPRPRGAAVGYGVNDVTQTNAGTSFTTGLLMRGDGRIAFSGTAVVSLSDIFRELSQSPPSNVIPDANWEPLASGIVRFHISYLLDNGDIVQVPPAYSMISPQTFATTSFLNGLPLGSGWMAVAFAPENAPASGRYVKALIVSMASASRDVLALASSSGQLGQIDALGTPGDGVIARALWETNLTTKVTFRPLLQNLRFYQRTLAVP